MTGDQTMTAHLWIEPMRVEHAPALFAALDHPDVAASLGDPDAPSVDAVVGRIEAVTRGPGEGRNERWWNFTVGLRDRREIVLGRLEATTYGDWGEVAYVFDPRHWGHGYATEGVEWLIGHLADAGVDELWACVAPTNERSWKLAERCGFERVTEWARPIASYEDGDVVLRRLSGAAHAGAGTSR